MIREILENEINEDASKLKSIIEKIQGLLIKAMKEDSKLGLDFPFDEINDQMGDIRGQLDSINGNA